MACIERMNFIIPATKIDQARLALINADEDLVEEDDLYTVLDWYDFQHADVGNGDWLLYGCYYEHSYTVRDSLEVLAPFAKDGGYALIVYYDDYGDDIYELLHVKDDKLDEIVAGPDEIFEMMMRKAKETNER